jgi:hypothetical protein
VYNNTANFVKLAEYTSILQEWNILRDQKDNEQVRIGEGDIYIYISGRKKN